jgi:hypothetical protein
MPSLTNEIKSLTIPWLLQDIWKNRKTGTVVLEQKGNTAKVFFRQGEIIFASSNSDDRTLGEVLVRNGKITQPQLDKCAKVMSKTNKKIGTVLFEMGIITPQDLVSQATLLAKQNILALFGWRTGAYRFEENQLPAAEIVPLPLNTRELILEGVRSLEWQEIRQTLPQSDTIVRKTRDATPLFQDSLFNQDELKVLSLVSGNQSMQQICDQSGIGDLKTLTALYLLLSLRKIEEGRGQVSFATEPTAPVTAPSEEATVTREMLQSAHDSLDIQNYYEILGVGHGSTPQEIKTAYFTLAKLYHPDRYRDTNLSDLRPKLETLMINLSEAYGVLSVKTKRDQYNLDLASGVKKYRKEAQTSAESEEINKASAEAQYNEGLKQMRVQNFWGAEEAFRWAVRLDPSRPEYYFYQGSALAHLPRRRHEAEEFFLKAINMAPSRIEYYLELGNYYMRGGLKPKAQVVYEKALKRDPNSEKVKQAIKKMGT